MEATRCIIPANPDVSVEYCCSIVPPSVEDGFKGIGVRISIYVQAIVALLYAYVTVIGIFALQPSDFESKFMNGELVDWDKIQEILNPDLTLGYALVIAAIVQARSTGLGLTVYHALLILNLNWIIFISGLPSFTLGFFVKKSAKTRIKRMICLHSGHITFTSAFAPGLFATIDHFDRTGTDCTPSTIYYVLGYHAYVDHPIFRHYWLAIYSLLAIPMFNISLIFLIFSIVILIAWVSFIPLSFVVRHVVPKPWRAILTLLAPASPMAMLVVLTEKTISINNVGPGEEAWTLGQTVALLITIPPLWKLASRVKETISAISRSPRLLTPNDVNELVAKLKDSSNRLRNGLTTDGVYLGETTNRSESPTGTFDLLGLGS